MPRGARAGGVRAGHEEIVGGEHERSAWSGSRGMEDRKRRGGAVQGRVDGGAGGAWRSARWRDILRVASSSWRSGGLFPVQFRRDRAGPGAALRAAHLPAGRSRAEALPHCRCSTNRPRRKAGRERARSVIWTPRTRARACFVFFVESSVCAWSDLLSRTVGLVFSVRETQR
jgi:hypothetical protein